MTKITFYKTCRICKTSYKTSGRNKIYCSSKCYILGNIKINKTTSCWEWQKAPDIGGYGQACWNHVGYKAHRLSWESFKNPIPEDHLVCHKCDNRSCCNPDHLFIGTQADNIADMVKKGRNNFKTRHGEENKNAKLTDEKVRKIRKLLKQGLPLRKIGKMFNVSFSPIFDIKHNRKWKHVI